ncbi:MAG: Gfo/Idh/MocA family protein [Acidimicrobiales bacterium]
MGAAIIGAGFAARVHAHALRVLGVPLVGIVASTQERSRAAAAELGARRWFADAAGLVADDEVTVVHICAPNHLHERLVDLTLDHHKHVICEKPLATSAAGALRLAERAGEVGVVSAVPFAYRYYPMVQEARSRACSGTLGRILFVHGSYLQDWLLPSTAGGWRVDANLGGQSRAFADIGSHWCDLAEWVAGIRINELAALFDTAIAERSAAQGHTFGPADGAAAARGVDTEDIACVVFRAEDGTSGSVTISQVSAGRKNRLLLEVDGAERSVTFDSDRAEELRVGNLAGSELLVRDGQHLSPEAARLSTLPAGHPQGYVDCFVGLLGEVYRSVADGRAATFPTFEDGARSARIVDAALRSVRERSWAKVEG